MAAVTVGFRWLDILEKEFDKAFVDLEVLVGDVCELEEEDVLKKAQQHLQALSSCFAQLTHKAQTIFQNNAKLEAELVHLRREACEGKAQLKVLKEKLDTLSIPQPPPEADPLSSDPKSSEIVVSQLTGIQNQLPEFIQAEEASQLQQENSALRRLVLGVQGELCGARLAAKYLDKELAGSDLAEEQTTRMIKMIDKNINDISLVKAVVLENNLMLKDISKKETVAPFPRPTFCPAKTLDELQTLMTRSDLIPILVTSKDSTLNKTATSMLKLLLTRELALAFSMTGLGLRRQRTKMKFDNSPSCLAIERALSQIPDYSQVPRCEVKTAIRLALKGAIDWSGQRGKRKDATGAAINLKTNQENALTPSRPEGSTARVLNSSHIAGEAVATSSRTAVNPSHTQTTGWDTFDAGPSWSTSEEMLLDAGSFVPPRDDVHDMVDNFPRF